MPADVNALRKAIIAKLDELQNDAWSNYSKHKNYARAWRAGNIALVVVGAALAAASAIVGGLGGHKDIAAWIAGGSALASFLGAFKPNAKPDEHHALQAVWELQARRVEIIKTYDVHDDDWLIGTSRRVIENLAKSSSRLRTPAKTDSGAADTRSSGSVSEGPDRPTPTSVSESQ